MRLLIARRLFPALVDASSQTLVKFHPSDSSRLFDSPCWSTTQLRWAKFSGADVKVGNVIERRGKIFEVIKAHHTTQGRQGAIIQVELRDVHTGSKVNERLRTNETIERIYAQAKSFNYLYTDDDTGNIILMEPDTYSQVEVPGHLFGESSVYLQDDMKVNVQLYNEQPMSVSIPSKVTCTVVEAPQTKKGSGTPPYSPSYKTALLQNGIKVQVPPHIEAGDKIVVNTSDNSYCGRV